MPPPATPPQGGPAPVAPAVFTRATLSAYLDRSEAALDRDIASGGVPPPCFRMRRSPRWRTEVIAAWMQAGGPPADEWAAMRAAEVKRR